MLIDISQEELILICDALSGYANKLSEGLKEFHLDLTKAGRISRTNERVDAQMLRGSLYKRWSNNKMGGTNQDG